MARVPDLHVKVRIDAETLAREAREIASGWSELAYRAEGINSPAEGSIRTWRSLPLHKRLWYWLTDGPKEPQS